LEDIQAGSFVFEFVGEIISNIEMAHRNKRYIASHQHRYVVVLDVDEST
jgi:hypothetical protein